MSRTVLARLCLAVVVPLSSMAHSQEPAATFFMGRVKYSNNDGNDCRQTGQDLMTLVSQTSTLQIRQEKQLLLTDAELFETPFLFMNGHNDFTFSEQELEALRSYLARGGFLMASGCCSRPGFPVAWRREFAQIFPGQKPLRLEYSHAIYRSFHRIDRIACLHEERSVHVEGLVYRDRVVAVLCPDGLCCAFSMQGKCDPGRGLSAEDGKKLALNIAVYALTH